MRPNGIGGRAEITDQSEVLNMTRTNSAVLRAKCYALTALIRKPRTYALSANEQLTTTIRPCPQIPAQPPSSSTLTSGNRRHFHPQKEIPLNRLASCALRSGIPCSKPQPGQAQHNVKSAHSSIIGLKAHQLGPRKPT